MNYANTAVVIVTFNGQPWIRDCLNSLRLSERQAHVIVVDNCSQDETVPIIEREYPEVEILRSSANVGFGIGNNLGIARALELGSEQVFLLNQDARVLPETLVQLLEFMSARPDFGIVSPLHCSPDANHIDAKTYTGYLRNHASEFLCDRALGRCESHYQILGINAAAWMVRSSVFNRVGGFDPLYFMYGEDDDLIQRFRHHGVKFALLPQSRIVHLRESPKSSQRTGFWGQVDRRARRVRSDLLVRVKQPGFSLRHMVAELIVFGALGPACEFLLDRKAVEFLGAITAMVRVFKQLPRIRRHARLCGTEGPHFLRMSAPCAQPSAKAVAAAPLEKELTP